MGFLANVFESGSRRCVSRRRDVIRFLARLPWDRRKSSITFPPVEIRKGKYPQPCLRTKGGAAPRNAAGIASLQSQEPDSEDQSDRSAVITSTRAARAAGSTDAITAAASSTIADPTTTTAPGIRTPSK